MIGARTEKYADYFDICAALVGCVPNVGVHVEKNRLPTILIDATKLIQDHLLPSLKRTKGNSDLLFEHGFDSFFPAMGWACGNLSDGGIPLILGFDSLPLVSNDNLKAFCAAFGTTGSGEYILSARHLFFFLATSDVATSLNGLLQWPKPPYSTWQM